MTSQEAIENIKKTMIIRRYGNIDIGIKYNREILIIERDLEVLEILKKVFNYKSVQKFVDNMTKDEFFKVKEWLEE